MQLRIYFNRHSMMHSLFQMHMYGENGKWMLELRSAVLRVSIMNIE